jgi:zinc protease
MKSTFLVLGLLLHLAAWADLPTEPGKDGGSKSESFQIHKYETQELENGLTILWIPDPALPYVSLEMMFRSGAAQDPKGKEGLASFTASMLEKGSKNHSATQISEDLEQIGSGFDAEADPDYSMASTSALSFHKDSALKQFAEILLQPAFTNAEIERYRKQVLASLQKLADHPEEFAEYLLPHFLFGEHPYGHTSLGSARAIKHIKRVDLQKYYGDNYTPQNAVLAVVGQYDEAWRENVIKAFEGWKAKSGANTDIPDFPEWSGSEV